MDVLDKVHLFSVIKKHNITEVYLLAVLVIGYFEQKNTFSMGTKYKWFI